LFRASPFCASHIILLQNLKKMFDEDYNSEGLGTSIKAKNDKKSHRAFCVVTPGTENRRDDDHYARRRGPLMTDDTFNGQWE
jgi:hypothetical protein